MKSKSEVTELLIKVQEGSNEAYKKLFPLVYDELKRIAFSQLRSEHKDITITETELVHEVYLKMIDQTSVKTTDKHHFMAIAARCMRQILVDHARMKKAEKRGGEQKDVTYVDELLKVRQQSAEIIQLDEKLRELSNLDQRLADVVTLRFFGQMTIDSVAQAIGVSERTVKRDWAKARGWLYKELK